MRQATLIGEIYGTGVVRLHDAHRHRFREQTMLFLATFDFGEIGICSDEINFAVWCHMFGLAGDDRPRLTVAPCGHFLGHTLHSSFEDLMVAPHVTGCDVSIIEIRIGKTKQCGFGLANEIAMVGIGIDKAQLFVFYKDRCRQIVKDAQQQANIVKSSAFRLCNGLFR